jgi:4-aminobutyrate aminotransferase-like enzyme
MALRFVRPARLSGLVKPESDRGVEVHMTVIAQDKKSHIPGIVWRTTPITVDHAEGSWVYGTDGSKWLDFCMGIAVSARSSMGCW